MLLGKANFC